MDKNAQVIKNAIARFKMERDEIVREGMIRLAKAGLEYLESVHNSHSLFMEHMEETNTMGWVVARDGQVIASGSHDGGDDDMPGTSVQTATQVVSGTNGWVAVILSEMEGYYRVDYEEDFLFDTSFNTASEFQTYFKKIDK